LHGADRKGGEQTEAGHNQINETTTVGEKNHHFYAPPKEELKKFS
jgi:hypothetical protein